MRAKEDMEAVLARELDLPYAAINVVANYAAGRGESRDGIHFESIEDVLQNAMGRVRGVRLKAGRRGGRAASTIRPMASLDCQRAPRWRKPEGSTP